MPLTLLLIYLCAMRIYLLNLVLFCCSSAVCAQGGSPVQQPAALATSSTLVINEVDADTPGFDDREFIELYGAPGEPLDGIALVLYRGNDNTVYASYDLSGFALNEEGFFVVGNALVPNVDFVIPNNTIRNGPDAIALYTAPVVDFPNGSPVVLDQLVDALVYDNNGPLAPMLLPLLLEGQPQVNEAMNGNGVLESMSRVPDGGEQRVTESYVAQSPTPGTFNIVPCEGGTLSVLGHDEGDDLVVCVDLPDEPIEVLVNGSSPGDGYLVLVCNQVNQIISVHEEPVIDFFGSATGPIRIWGLGYTGTLNQATLQPGLPITGIQSDECAVLSDGYVSAIRQTCIPPECLGGVVTVNGLSSAQTICWNGDNPIMAMATDSEFTPNYAWVLVNVSGAILAVSENANFDLSTYGSGTFFVRGIAYTGVIDTEALQPGLQLANVTSDGCLSLSENQVQVSSSFCAYTGGCSDLFISEYIEGTSNNKALELYNPTPFAINLGPYILQTYNNSATVPTNSLNLQGVIEPGDVYVVANSEAAAPILAVANVTSNVTLYNGNDPIVLRKNGEIIDIMGIIGPEADPLEPNGFEVDNGSGSMSEHTLVRKSTVTEGSTDWEVGQNQWEVYPQNTFSFLGSHSIGLCEFPDESTITFTNASITIIQGMTAQIGVANDWPVDEAIVEVTVTGGTAIAGVNYADIFTATVTLPAETFGPQLINLATFNAPALEEPVTIELQLVPVTPALTAIETLLITILPFQDPPQAPYLPIIEVHGEDEDSFEALSEGVFCELRGVVHGVNLTPNGLLFTLIDPTAGIAVYHPNQNFGYQVAEGDSIHVIGEIDQFKGLTRIVPVFIEFISSGNGLRAPLLVSAFGEHTESLPVEFKCIRIDDPAQWINTPPYFDVDLTAGQNTFVMRIYETTDIFGTEPPNGVFTVLGIGSQEDEFDPYNEGYFFIPQKLEDLSTPVDAGFSVPDAIVVNEAFDLSNLTVGGGSFTWVFGDGNTSIDANPQHTYDAPGSYTIVLTAFDTDGVCADQVSITVQVLPVGVHEITALGVQMYPNPARDAVVIEGDDRMSRIRVFDLTGRMVVDQHVGGAHRVQLDVSTWSAGSYLMDVDGTRTRLIVQP